MQNGKCRPSVGHCLLILLHEYRAGANMRAYTCSAMPHKTHLPTTALQTLGSVVVGEQSAWSCFLLLATSQSNVVTVTTRLACPVKSRGLPARQQQSQEQPAEGNSNRQPHSTEQQSTARAACGSTAWGSRPGKLSCSIT